MRHLTPFALLLAAAAMPVTAAVVGTTVPPKSLDAAQIRAALPAGPARATWLAWLQQSEQAMVLDKAVLEAERAALRKTGRPIPDPAPEGDSAASAPLDRDAAWYAGAEARAVADNIVSFQTPSGGWGKNQDRSGPPRVPGQGWIVHDGKGGPYLAQDGAGGWSFVGTLDNDATITELRFLARVQAALPGAPGEAYRRSFLKGVRYVLRAELPGGGWPQTWPLQGLYHDALTLNDNLLVNAATLLQEVGRGAEPYAFVPADLRVDSAAAAARAVDVLLATQVQVAGQPTIWAQQYDPLTRQPIAARNFEPVALSTGESANVLSFLMRQDRSDPRIARSVEAATRWFADHALTDVAWRDAGEGRGRMLVAEQGAGPLWARFYDTATGRPIFGDRDLTIHDDVGEISLERRNGYSWFNTSGTNVARAHERWAAARP
ncbi:pectate lyase [Croceibacterium sp. TMG7-5b_MA50]|uniref:pectate lyase n=1 Tax=Croceibacterium sp. TMG7-5b_MA50 TaxID=3121290 RepID=UPI0032216114